jgi:hypothetical protein
LRTQPYARRRLGVSTRAIRDMPQIATADNDCDS